MRPRSLAGPLMLIGIGTLFLIRNVWPEIPLYEFAARYWPFILIIWGTIRLGEVLFWAISSRPLPQAGVSGGEWTAVVLLCVFGSFFFWGMNLSSRWPSGRITVKGLEIFGEPHEYPVKAEQNVGKVQRVVLEMGRGNVKITGAEGEQIRITGRKTVRAFSQSDADKGDKQTPLEVVLMGDHAVIRTNHDRLDASRSITSDLEIAVPKGISVEGRGRYGDFDVQDLGGNVEITSENAGVRVQNITGNVRADLKRSDIVRAVNVKGSVEIKGRGQDVEVESVEGLVTVNGSYSGEISFRNLAKPLRFESPLTELRVEKTSGYLRMALGNLTAENISGPVRLSTRTRDVQLRDFTDNVEITLERGDVELRPKQLGKVYVRTKSGNLDLVLPTGAKFELSAKTDRGEITNDFGAPLRHEEEGRGASLRGSVGTGPQITLETDRGAILVRKSGTSAAEPSQGLLPKTLTPPSSPEPPKVPARVEQ